MRWFNKIFTALTRKERLTFMFASAGAVVSFTVVIAILIAQVTHSVPAAGGQYTEGMLGQPEYINPVIASSETDADIVKMVYQNVPDIADTITPSADLKTWTVHLKEGISWQDGTRLTSDDVVFTVQSIQNPDANSPLYQSWQGVTVTRESELEVQFTLSAPYAFFGRNLANLYVLPKHIFAETPPGNWRLSDYNLKPVGSGAYAFVSYAKGADGFISSYSLNAWNGTSDQQPLIQNFNFKFFNDENALVKSFNAGQINGFGNASPEDISAIARPYSIFSWRTSGYYAVFFDQSKNIALQDPAVREALSIAIDRNDLINQTFGASSSTQKGTPEYGPVPVGAAYYTDLTQSSSLDVANALLNNAGWTLNSNGTRSKTLQKSTIPLVINLTVPQIDFLAKTSAYLRATWTALGVQTNVIMDSPQDIVSNAIKNRDYEGLLFGNVLGPSSDLYSFWDSSQRFYPGLNLSLYQSNTVDALIESARTNTNTTAIAQKIGAAQSDIARSYAAVFLYSPNYLYVTGNNIQGIDTSLVLTDQSNRFREVGAWYLNTARVLK